MDVGAGDARPPRDGQVNVSSGRDAYVAGGSLVISTVIASPARAESVATLRGRAPALEVAEASMIAGTLGDLGPAVERAAGHLAATGMPAGEYQGRLEGCLTVLLAGAKPSYPAPLAAATRLALEWLRDTAPAIASAVEATAFLAAGPVPVTWLPPEARGQLATGASVTLAHAPRAASCPSLASMTQTTRMISSTPLTATAWMTCCDYPSRTRQGP
jgi:hypothetical protein